MNRVRRAPSSSSEPCLSPDGGARQLPWQLAVFESCEPNSSFTPLEWEKWTSLVLAALSKLKGKGYIPFQSSRRESTATTAIPMLDMLRELEELGYVTKASSSDAYVITELGEVYRKSLFQYPGQT